MIDPALRIFTGTATSIAAATETVLTVDSAIRNVEILHVIVQRTAGTAANYQVSIGAVASYTISSPDSKYETSVKAVATLTNDIGSPALAVCSTDSLGKLYLRFNPDAGSDNSFSYHVAMRVWN